MLVVVLKDWVIETNEACVGVEHLDDLGEVRERTGQAVDLVDDDHVDFAGGDISEQTLLSAGRSMFPPEKPGSS